MIELLTILASLALLFLLIPFHLWMIVDCAHHETPRQKTAWILAILLLGPLVGSPLYWFIRRRDRLKVQRRNDQVDAMIAEIERRRTATA